MIFRVRFFLTLSLYQFRMSLYCLLYPLRFNANVPLYDRCAVEAAGLEQAAFVRRALSGETSAHCDLIQSAKQ
jgi:hypothetical protein